MKMTSKEIINFLSTNKSERWKLQALRNIEDILAVNDLLEDKDIYTILHDSTYYDALYDYNMPFEDLLNDFYMLHLDIKENSNDVMIILQMIYS